MARVAVKWIQLSVSRTTNSQRDTTPPMNGWAVVIRPLGGLNYQYGAVARVQDYLGKSVEVLDFIERQCGL